MTRSTASSVAGHGLRRRVVAAALVAAGIVVGGTAQAREVGKPPPTAPESCELCPLLSKGLPYRYIGGLEVLRTEPHKLLVSRGSAVDNTGRGLIRIERGLALDIRTVGPGGRDDVVSPLDIEAGAAETSPDPSMPNGRRASVDGVPASGWYHVVYMQDPTRDVNSAILTRQISSTRMDRPGDARPPAGFTLRRHAPVAYYYDGRTGFRPQVCYGWPQPICIFTSAGTRPEFAVVENLTSPTWTKISLARFMPDSARIVRLQAVVTGVTGGGGAEARTLAQRDGSVFLGRARDAGDVQTLIFEITTNSRETIAVRTDPGVKLSIYAVGFAMAQTY